MTTSSNMNGSPIPPHLAEQTLSLGSEQERRLQHVNRLYAVLSAVNRAMTRRAGRLELLQEICRILVEVGAFRLAWFALPDAEGWLVPEAAFGDSLGYLATVRVSSRDIPEGHGSAGRSIRENRPIICNNIPANPTMFPWRGQAERNGFNANAGFPVLLPSGVIASLVLYSTECDFFSSDEEQLLMEICADLGYALEFSATEERLERERKLLKVVVGTIPDLIWLKDATGSYLSCNPAYEEFFGVTQGEIVGRSGHAGVADDLAACFRAKDQEALTTCRTSKHDIWFSSTDKGHRALMETIKIPLLADSGELDGILGIARDVTAARQAEQAQRELVEELREREEKYRLLAENGSDTIWLMGMDGVFTYHSPAVATLRGYTPEEANAIPLERTLAPESLALVRELFRDETGQPVEQQWGDRTLELQMYRRDGTLFWTETTIRTVRDRQGGVSTLQGSSRDITVRKQAEDELRDSEQRFRSFSTVAQDAIIQLDDEGIVTFWNPAAERIFGYSAEEIIGLAVHETLAPPRYLEAYRAARDHFARTGEGPLINRTLDLAALRKSGEEFPAELSISSFQLGGRWHAAGLFRDITERKRTEAALYAQAELLQQEVDQRSRAQELLLEQRRQLELLNRELETRVAIEVKKSREKDQSLVQSEKMASIGQLAAGVAHEINNPMGFITSNLHVLADYFQQIVDFDSFCQERLEGELSAECRESMESRRRSLEMENILSDGTDLIGESLDGADRVTKIVQDLKSFSRVDRVEKELVLLSDCLESALTICANELKYVATVRKEYETVPVLFCHPGQLNQVVLNLLVNAGQAIVPPGEIVLRSWHDAGFIYASVSDTGEGIPEEIREQIFNPFYTTKEVGKGTGLGLSISYEIIKKHKGEFLVESVVGSGTTFTVKLPRSTGEEDAA